MASSISLDALPGTLRRLAAGVAEDTEAGMVALYGASREELVRRALAK